MNFYLIGYLFVNFWHGEWSISYTRRWSLHRASCCLQVDANAFWSHDWCEGARRHSRPGTCAIVEGPHLCCKHWFLRVTKPKEMQTRFRLAKHGKTVCIFYKSTLKLYEFVIVNSFFRIWHQGPKVCCFPCSLRGLSVWDDHLAKRKLNKGGFNQIWIATHKGDWSLL